MLNDEPIRDADGFSPPAPTAGTPLDRSAAAAQVQNHAETGTLTPSKRGWGRTLLRGLVAIVILVIAALMGLYFLTQQQPKFYAEALAIPDQQAYADGESMEIAALYWRNDVIERDQWLAEFSEAQINGWFASDMPRKFARALPAEYQSPRVSIEPDRLQIAITTKVNGVETVVVAAFDVFLTDYPDQFGVRILSLHAGWAPLPISLFVDPLTDYLERQNISVLWYDDSDGITTALLTVPTKLLTFEGRQVAVEELSVNEDRIRVAGKSLREEKDEPLQPSEPSGEAIGSPANAD